MGRIKLKGPPRDGAEVFDEPSTRDILNSYGDAVDQQTARRAGQAAGAAVLQARRRLWALAERLVPGRLAAALRALPAPSGDRAAREGIATLRHAIADWLDPPPCCRWCRRPIRRTDQPCIAARGKRRRVVVHPPQGVLQVEQHTRRASATPASNDAPVDMRNPAGFSLGHRTRPWTAHPIACRPSRVRRDVTGKAACGTLSLYPAGYADLATMAAALACPRGASGDYDVAADRDARALVAATGLPPSRRHGDASHADGSASWSSEAMAALHAACDAAGPADFPPPLAAARLEFDRARDASVRTNGRIVTAVQTRYGAPQAGVTRADLLQGTAMGLDRAALDYDASKAAFPTYAAEWAGQGLSAVLQERDLVDTPPWVADLRRRAVAALTLRGAGPDAAGELLRAVEALVDAGARARPDAAEVMRAALVVVAMSLPYGGVVDRSELAHLFILGEVIEAVMAPRPPIGKWQARLRRAARGSRPRPPWATRRKAGAPDRSAAQIVAALAEDPERARERVAAVVGRLLGLGQAGKDATGSGLLAALRHGAPVFVGVGAGGDDGEDAQGTDGAGGLERRAHVLAAPDEHQAWEDEQDAAALWQRALGHLAALRAMPGDGPILAEVVRRHLGLDSAIDDVAGTGATGESFQHIGATGIGPDRRVVTKETARKAFNRGVAALRSLAAGDHPCTSDDLAWLGWADEEPQAVLRLRPAPSSIRLVTSAAPRRDVVDAGAYDSFRESMSAVSW